MEHGTAPGSSQEEDSAWGVDDEVPTCCAVDGDARRHNGERNGERGTGKSRLFLDHELEDDTKEMAEIEDFLLAVELDHAWDD